MSRPFRARQGLKGNIFLGHSQGDPMHYLVKGDNNNNNQKKSSKLFNQNLISAIKRETRPSGTINMALILSTAVESDADRIAATHMAAFGLNMMLQAQSVTPTVRDGLRTCITRRALDDIRDPKIAVLVVRDQNEIVSFAKWHLPVLESESYVEPPWVSLEEINWKGLDEWTERVGAASRRILGDLPRYRKFIQSFFTV